MKNLLSSGRLFIVVFLTLVYSNYSNSQSFNGYALYNDMGEFTTYLIDKDGNVAHSWSCSDMANYSVKLKDNGNIVRGAVDLSSQLFGAAGGGIVQELDQNANVVWEFNYSNSNHLSHHDLEVLPNGNVLLIAWEVKSASEVIQAGYDGSSMELWPTHIIEVAQNGSGGQIVWEWHIWDHLIQDHDQTKDNYGVVADHPELMDINAVAPFDTQFGGDWFHVNGISYNEDLDQIIFSSRTASEIFIIDHSTTTAEAASHSGGNAGMGGDFLYRWGKKFNYGQIGQSIPNAVHDPRWIPDDGRPNGGYIQFINNEGASGGNTAVDAIDPPISGYNYTMTGNAFGPANYDWRHTCAVSAWGQSSSATMSNGNVFVNISGEYMYEVDQNGNTIWQYNAGPAKAFRYECDHPGIAALLGPNPCGLGLDSDIATANINVYPNPSSTGVFHINGFNTADQNVTITAVDVYGNKVLTVENTNELDLSMMSNGVYFVTLNFGDDQIVTKKISLIR